MFSIRLARMAGTYAFGDMAAAMRLTMSDMQASLDDEVDNLTAFASTRRLGNCFISARRTIMTSICRRLEAQHAGEYWVTGISGAWPLSLSWELATTILSVPDMIQDIRGLRATSLLFPELDGMPTIWMTPKGQSQGTPASDGDAIPVYRIVWTKQEQTNVEGPNNSRELGNPVGEGSPEGQAAETPKAEPRVALSHKAYGDEAFIRADALEAMLLKLLRDFTGLVDTHCAIAKAHPVYASWEEEVHDLITDRHDWAGFSELLADTVSILPHDA